MVAGKLLIRLIFARYTTILMVSSYVNDTELWPSTKNEGHSCNVNASII